MQFRFGDHMLDVARRELRCCGAPGLTGAAGLRSAGAPHPQSRPGPHQGRPHRRGVGRHRRVPSHLLVDSTPHKVRMVKVAPGVELEALDWAARDRRWCCSRGPGQRARLRPIRLSVHRHLPCHRDHPPRRPAVEPAAGRLRRPDPGKGRYRGDRCLGHQEGGVRRAFGRGHGIEPAGTGFPVAGREARLPRRGRPVATQLGVGPRFAPGRRYRG